MGPLRWTGAAGEEGPASPGNQMTFCQTAGTASAQRRHCGPQRWGRVAAMGPDRRAPAPPAVPGRLLALARQPKAPRVPPPPPRPPRERLTIFSGGGHGFCWLCGPAFCSRRAGSGAAEPCGVCCDAGGAPAGAAVLMGSVVSAYPLTTRMLPVGGGAGAGPPGTAPRRTQQSPQHQGHLVAGRVTAPAGAAVRGAGARCAARGRGARRGGAVRGAGARCAARGRGARRGAAVQPHGTRRVGQVLPVVQLLRAIVPIGPRGPAIPF